MFSELQMDALAEIFNVGAGRAAANISEIVDDEVRLSVPLVEFKASQNITPNALKLNAEKFGVVRQHFHTTLEATVLLLFSEENTMEIVRDMMNSELSLDELAEFEQDAMCEIGNIVINACLSAMADMLDMKLESSLPNYSLVSDDTIVREITQNPIKGYTLLLNVDFTIVNRKTEGRLVLLLSSASLANLAEHIDRFLAGI